MPKKKPRFNKKQRQQLTKYLVRFGIPVFGLVVGLGIGVVWVNIITSRRVPQNLVWAADNTVKVPKDLQKFLLKQNDCRSYKGAGSPTGVGVWGVYQVAQDKFAKISYGCSINLNLYIMAVKQSGHWALIQPTEYFANVDTLSGNGYLPKCEVLAKYKITKNVESFCVQADGVGRANDL